MANETTTVDVYMVTRPGELDCVLEQLANVDGTVVRSATDEGRLVVNVAADNCDELHRRVDILQFVEGLKSSKLVYH